MSHSLADISTASPIRTAAEAGAYIASVCFKHGPPRRIGIELEWLLTDPDDPLRHPDLPLLRTALGPHAPRTLNPDSPARPLPAGGLVTVEPGGQVEISSAPATSCSALIEKMRRDVERLDQLLRPTGFRLSGRAADAGRSGRRILHTPRYDAMATGFARISPAGAVMMCATAATQICVDLGRPDQAPLRWRAAHLLGPVLLAAFANSPADGHVSARMAAWWALDPVRTEPPGSLELDDYVRRALDTPVLARQRPAGDWLVPSPVRLRDWLAAGEPLATHDLDLHLSMLFPPVRPQGYLELRYLDAQPEGEWLVPLALIAALFGDPVALAEAAEACRPAADRWRQATEVGLADPLLAAAARELADIGDRVLGDLRLSPADLELVRPVLRRRLRDGISPAAQARNQTAVVPEAEGVAG
ncbi:MAG TPA: glutamate-cysteine ligase family protein [Jatrophihabitans sp.]|nr:glutamate-cysteine ligase family protein [Jatrophihabitans sp.]